MQEMKRDPLSLPVAAEEAAPGVVEVNDYDARIYAQRTTIGDRELEQAKAEEGNSIVGNFADAFTSGNNIAYQTIRSLGDAAASGPVDPTWEKERATSWVDAQGSAIALDQRWRYLSANNEQHAQRILDTSMENQRKSRELSLRSGITPIIAPFAVSLVDVDLPLAIIGGSMSKGARLLATATKAKPFFKQEATRLLRGAAGGSTLAVAGAVDYAADPNSEWSVIPTLGVLGAGIGTIVPGTGRLQSGMAKAQLKAADELADAVERGIPPVTPHGAGDTFGFVERRRAEEAEYEAAIAHPATNADGTPVEPPREPFAVMMKDAELSPINTEDAIGGAKGIGAAQAYTPGAAGPGVDSIASDKIKKTILRAEQELQQSGAELKLYDDIIEMEKKYGKVGKAAYYMKEAINSTLVPNFHRLFRGNSAVAKVLASKLFTDAEGILRNVNTADSMMRQYQWDIMATTVPYHEGFDQFIKDAYPTYDVTQRFTKHRQLHDAYARQIITELQARAYDPPGSVRAIPDYIKKAADAIDEFHRTEIKQAKGLPGETPRFGWDTIKERSGYYKQVINPNKQRKVLTDLANRYGSKQARNMLNKIIQKAYLAVDPTLDPKDALIWATANVNAAATKDAGLSTNMIGILADGGSERLYSVLTNNGISNRDANRLIDTLLNRGKERGKAGHLKHRLDIDLRMTIDGVHLLDLFDTDMMTHLNRRGRQSAGMAALARHGIDSRQSLNEIWDAISAEQAAKGRAVPGKGAAGKVYNFLNAPRELDEEMFNDMMSYFTGDPIAGGMSPLLSEVRKISQLALLNQLGLTSVGEYGALWGAYGFTHFWNELPAAMKSAMNNKSPFVQELHDFNVLIPEERLMPDGGHYELDQLNMSDLDSFRQQMTSGLNQLTHLQGTLSGFNVVRRTAQYMAAHMMSARLMEGLKFGKTATTSAPFSAERLADLGLTKPNDIARMKRLADAAQFNGERFVKLNMDQWTDQDIQWYKRILYSNVDKYVHLARAGETSYWFHKGGIASLFFHLKSFPLTAMSKQAYRNARIGDPEMIYQFLFGLATAGMAYSAKQVLNGKFENLDPQDIGMGAINYSNFTGWFPMWANPILALTGMEYDNGRGIGGVMTPAGVSVFQKLSEIPGIPADVLRNGTLSNSSIRGLQSLPIVGNIYGAPLIWNALKSDGGRSSEPKPKPIKQTTVPEMLQPSDENTAALREAGYIQ